MVRVLNVPLVTVPGVMQSPKGLYSGAVHALRGSRYPKYPESNSRVSNWVPLLLVYYRDTPTGNRRDTQSQVDSVMPTCPLDENSGRPN